MVTGRRSGFSRASARSMRSLEVIVMCYVSLGPESSFSRTSVALNRFQIMDRGAGKCQPADEPPKCATAAFNVDSSRLK